MAIARVTEIISGSKKGIEDAVTTGVARAGKTLENVQSAWVKDINTVVKNGKVVEWRVTMMVTFIVEGT
jgi:flavin-binding protein dodecin